MRACPCLGENAKSLLRKFQRAGKVTRIASLTRGDLQGHAALEQVPIQSERRNRNLHENKEERDACPSSPERRDETPCDPHASPGLELLRQWPSAAKVPTAT
ncbi:hypothetical protein GCM10011390_50060 [Aureimonas endophytica]|uniref:Uncharacterized protein n=1 Tax=Aureimonas endophytica TaxID=2027858 RepID=A0A917EDB3_9HYPH|nr:hypothetical protein GCM10011390_50060 [Aureimonas endophytica]